jgi:hypothetical protein
MHQNLTVEQISAVLFNTDPMGTCCKENDCFDEYDNIANAVFESLASGRPTAGAVRDTLIEWFEVESVDPLVLASVVQALESRAQD